MEQGRLVNFDATSETTLLPGDVVEVKRKGRDPGNMESPSTEAARDLGLRPDLSPSGGKRIAFQVVFFSCRDLYQEGQSSAGLTGRERHHQERQILKCFAWVRFAPVLLNLFVAVERLIVFERLTCKRRCVKSSTVESSE